MPEIDRDKPQRPEHHHAVKHAALLILLAPALAHADERATNITIAGMLGAIEGTDTGESKFVEPDPLTGPRVTLSFEHAALALPDTRGYRFDGSLVPEITAGAFVDEERAQGFVGAGVRAELRMSQREMGLFRVSARGAFYLAGRGLVVGDDRKPYGEVALGEYFIFGSDKRIGFEFSALFTSAPKMSEFDDGMRSGGMAQIYLGWKP